MTDYYTADPHFGHRRIIELCERPFEDVDEMNHAIITNYNAVATEDDRLFILGDAALGKLDESLECIRQINAYTLLIPGNHDRPSYAYQSKGDIPAKIERARERYLEYFDEVYTDQKTSAWEAPISERSGRPVLMSHYPYDGDSHGEDRHGWLRAKDQGQPIIHGHVHTEWQIRGRQFNVGVDVNSFEPVHEDTLINWLQAM